DRGGHRCAAFLAAGVVGGRVGGRSQIDFLFGLEMIVPHRHDGREPITSSEATMTLPNRSLTSALALPAVTVTVVTGDHEGPQRGHLTPQAVALQTVQNFSRRVPGNAELLRELLQGRHRTP